MFSTHLKNISQYKIFETTTQLLLWPAIWSLTALRKLGQKQLRFRIGPAALRYNSLCKTNIEGAYNFLKGFGALLINHERADLGISLRRNPISPNSHLISWRLSWFKNWSFPSSSNWGFLCTWVTTGLQLFSLLSSGIQNLYLWTSSPAPANNVARVLTSVYLYYNKSSFFKTKSTYIIKDLWVENHAFFLGAFNTRWLPLPNESAGNPGFR